MYAAGPRIERRFWDRVAKVDDSSLPMAETYRRIRGVADEMGVPRPSYERVRLQLREVRLRSDERKKLRRLLFELAYNTRRAEYVMADLLELAE